MGFKRFSVLLGLRLSLIMVSLLLLIYLGTEPGYHAATLLMTFIVIGQTVEVFQFVSRTNAEITRFLDAARYADYSQRFNLGAQGAGFEELGNTFTDILDRFQSTRAGQEEELRHLKALMEHVPIPLLSVYGDGTLTLWNNAARRLFGIAHVTRLPDLQQFGEDFAKQISTMTAGERRLATFKVDDMEQQLSLAASQIMIGSKVERLISLQDIQSELDAAQLQAWQDLVRVLTHEIMNSITPVASLSKTAVDLVEDVATKVTDHPNVVDDLKDVRDAVQTVARRSDALMNFVSSYRRLTRLPPPDKKQILIREVFDDLRKLAAQDWDDKDIILTTHIEPSELDFTADRDMVDQILINLLKNAEQALATTKHAAVRLSARLNRRGKVVIEVSDNGSGINPEIAAKVFVPFFTTKREGSGVGLALTRQVMTAHSGSVLLGQSDEGGAKFTLTF